MSRILSYVEQISEVKPIDNSDNLELLSIRGWKVVAKKGDFSPGDLCVYFEIDSVLPPLPIFDFLKPRGYKVKSIKLRGQLSQGLAIPINDIKEFFDIDISKLGESLDHIIGVKHIDETIIDSGIGLSFPSFIKKTEAERIQNIPLTDLQNKSYEVSIKLDGSSMTVFYNNGQYGVCSRNRLLLEDDNSKYSSTANNKYKLNQILPTYCNSTNRNLALQGELIGEGVQGNKEKITGNDYYIFNVWDIDKQAYLSQKERLQIVTDLGLKPIPLLYEEPFTISESLDKDSLILMADGKSLFSNVREGLVFKTIDGSLSFKVISNKYLLASNH